MEVRITHHNTQKMNELILYDFQHQNKGCFNPLDPLRCKHDAREIERENSDLISSKNIDQMPPNNEREREKMLHLSSGSVNK